MIGLEVCPGGLKLTVDEHGCFWGQNDSYICDKHIIFSSLYVLIEHESYVQITSTYPESGAVSPVLGLTPLAVLPY